MNINKLSSTLAIVLIFFFLFVALTPLYSDTSPGKTSLESKKFIRLLDEKTSTREILGEITLLNSGERSFQKRMEIIKRAQKNINVMTFILYNGDIGSRFCIVLMKKARLGIEVNFILDGMNVVTQKVLQKIDITPLLKKMKESGINVYQVDRPWKKPWMLNKRSHEKLMIVDGLYGITGGMNITDEYLRGGLHPEAWRDTDIYVEGPAVSEMQDAFIKNLLYVRKKAKYKDVDKELKKFKELPGLTSAQRKQEYWSQFFPPNDKLVDAKVRFVHSLPRNNQRRIKDYYLATLKNAERYVWLETPYFIPDDEIIEALIEAASRGIDVRILTNSPQSNDMGKNIAWGQRYYYKELISNSVKIYEWQGPTLHSKVLAADSAIASVGSFNLDRRSMNLNAEEIVIVRNRKFAASMTSMIGNDFQRCSMITLEDIKVWNKDLKNRLRMKAVHIFAPLL